MNLFEFPAGPSYPNWRAVWPHFGHQLGRPQFLPYLRGFSPECLTHPKGNIGDRIRTARLRCELVNVFFNGAI